ncbi:hypothetical protein XENTR_v10013252 [Xenopus tropicalis]|nr:hypothetical protein XENTR_v10013252 [Xenopus tropicalis]KAE8600445.1 hypothetical protein XENTR_v10013252 [Xenopus tropicalis]
MHLLEAVVEQGGSIVSAAVSAHRHSTYRTPGALVMAQCKTNVRVQHPYRVHCQRDPVTSFPLCSGTYGPTGAERDQSVLPPRDVGLIAL